MDKAPQLFYFVILKKKHVRKNERLAHKPAPCMKCKNIHISDLYKRHYRMQSSQNDGL